MEIKVIRLKNLLALAADYRRIQEFCEAVEIQPAQFSQFKAGTKAIGDVVARRIESKLGLATGHMDTTHAPEWDGFKKKPGAARPDTSAMALAYIIEAMPPQLREKFKSLALAVASEVGDSGQQKAQQHDDGQADSVSGE